MHIKDSVTEQQLQNNLVGEDQDMVVSKAKQFPIYSVFVFHLKELFCRNSISD